MLKKSLLLLMSVFILLFSSCNAYSIYESKNEGSHYGKEELSQRNADGYRLKQVVVFSRHNVRSPLTKEGSAVYDMTPHEWFDWTSNSSELSIRGGVLETEMGQYFRKWLVKEKLFEDNYDPKNINVSTDEVRIYANSMQRTLATANYFLTGLFPVSDMDIEHHMKFNEMDPVFNPILTNIDDKFVDAATNQMEEIFSKKTERLKPDYKLIEDVIDVKESKEYKEGNFIEFKIDDSEFVLKEGEEPKVKGSLNLACKVSDALTFQYYESDDREASFGKNIPFEDWEKITEVRDVYEDVLFTAPLVATNVANPLLKEILKEIKNDKRKFTFLCGHDSNVASLLAALSVEEYNLPYAIEKKTPIGCKLTLSTWVKEENPAEEYMTIDLIYQKVEQLRGIEMLDEKNPPAIYKLSFKGLSQNEEGFYKKEDVINAFSEAISRYNVIDIDNELMKEN